MAAPRKKLAGIGHGGIKCPCCAPKPGTRAIKKVLRRGISRENNMMLKEGIEDYLLGKEPMGVGHENL